MAEIVRDVVINVAVQNAGTTFNTANADEFGKKLDSVGKSLDDIRTQLDQTDTASVRASSSTDNFNKELVKLTSGALHAVRGLALLAGATDDDIASTIRMVAAAQSGIDIFKGITTAVEAYRKGLLAAAAAKVIAFPELALLAAVAAGVLAIANAYRAAEEAAEALEEAQADAFRDILSHQAELDRAVTETNKEYRDTLEGAEKMARVTQDLATNERLILEARKLGRSLNAADASDREQLLFLLTREKSLLEDQKDIRRSMIQDMKAEFAAREQAIAGEYSAKQRAADEELRSRKQILESRQRELETAVKLREEEEARAQTIAATIGNLTKEQERELKRILDKLNAGGELTDRELKQARTFGGDEFGRAAQASNDKISAGRADKSLVDAVAKAAGIDTAGAAATATAAAAAAATAAANVSTAEVAGAELEKRRTAELAKLVKERDKTIKEQGDILRSLITQDQALRTELELVKDAQRQYRQARATK